MKRLAGRIVVGGRTNGFPAATNRRAVLNCVQSYREHMWKYSDMRHIEVWYSRIDYESSLQFVSRPFRWYIDKQSEKSRQRSSLQVFPRIVVEVDGEDQLKIHPPLHYHMASANITATLIRLV